jgi:NADPH-dependent glutamate synthase beta subunit-like oxidoreductase/Pyruvate/2-oxoacid:ferredoxin oxidoreductase delta subunit
LVPCRSAVRIEVGVAVKKVKKRRLGGGAFAGTSRSREQSPLRPKYVESKPPCRNRCPSGNRIRKFATTTAQAERLGKTMEQALEQAWEIYTDTSPFPAVCGRVCPAPCETECNRRELEGAVNINKIERAIGDFGIEKGLELKRLTDEKMPQKVAVIGAGPSGLSCAYQLARRGYGVTVFETLSKPGGMLRWGIPGYRLPESVLDSEIQGILDLGVELKCGVKVGKDISLDDLQKSFDAIYVALGAQQGVRLGVEGEEAPNVFAGVDFLNRFHHGEKLDLGKDVVVIVVGGGDTAIDAARICKRLGANVTILYRRTLQEMPAIKDEVEEAIQEGIKIEFLAAPIGFRKTGDVVSAMRCIRMELGEPDSSGRRRPIPIEGSEFEIPATAIISAISQAPDFSGFESLIEGKDWVRVDDQGATKVDGIWAGGDVTQLDLVTTAVGHGRRAAEAIDRKFLGKAAETDSMEVIHTDHMRLDHYEKMERHTPSSLGMEDRLTGVDVEVNQGFTEDELVSESRRCMSCGYCFDCEKCWMFCQDQAIDKPMQKGVLYTFKLQNCTGCKKCAEECPCGFIVMQ